MQYRGRGGADAYPIPAFQQPRIHEAFRGDSLSAPLRRINPVAMATLPYTGTLSDSGETCCC
jgi:hypothetical protein